MNDRNTIKQDLRTLAEIGIVGVLGKVPRKLRRAAGRQFASESYRKLQNLPTKNHKTNSAVVAWIIKEYNAYRANRLSKIGDKVDRTDAEVDGGTTSTVADQRKNRESVEEPLDDTEFGGLVGE